jgi:divalent metal cation (Fe/Co/Zn/Cd) transporter
MHVEVPPKQTLSAAHEQVSQLEEHVRSSLPEVADVITHIEPALEVVPNGLTQDDRLIEQQVIALLNERFPSMDWHHVHASVYDGGYALTMHVILPAQITLESAHKVAEAAEMVVRTEIPYVTRVTIHTEPPENT